MSGDRSFSTNWLMKCRRSRRLRMTGDDVRDLGCHRLRVLCGERGERLLERSRWRDRPDAVHIPVNDDATGAEDDDPRAQALDVLDDVRAVEDGAAPLGEDANEMAQHQDRSDVEPRFRFV